MDSKIYPQTGQPTTKSEFLFENEWVQPFCGCHQSLKYCCIATFCLPWFVFSKNIIRVCVKTPRFLMLWSYFDSN